MGQLCKTRANVNEVLAQELHKPVTRKIKRRKPYLSCSDNIWATDLAEIRSLSFFSSGVKYLLYAIDVFTKYAWVKPLKDKKDKTILDGFIGIVN